MLQIFLLNFLLKYKQVQKGIFCHIKNWVWIWGKFSKKDYQNQVQFLRGKKGSKFRSRLKFESLKKWLIFQSWTWTKRELNVNWVEKVPFPQFSAILISWVENYYADDWCSLHAVKSRIFFLHCKNSLLRTQKRL